MKTGGSTLGWQIGGFIWCIFMGITFVSIGLGAIYPPLNRVAQPILCPNGQMIYNESTSNPSPGTTITQIGWLCVDKRAETTTELDIFQIAVVAGPLYGLVLEALLLITVWLFRRRAASQATHSAAPAHSRPAAANRNLSTSGHPSHRAAASQNTQARMKELQELRAQQLISEAEYQQKRDEILKDL